MSKQGKRALERKLNMQNKIKEMEEKVKELEERAERELGKYIIKKWKVRDDVDSKIIYEIINELEDEATRLLEEKRSDMGKYDM